MLRLPEALVRGVLRKLDMMEAAARLDDLRSPPGNRLESLSGDRKGWYGIRVNDQWRIVFRWVDGAAEDVTLTDYHQDRAAGVERCSLRTASRRTPAKCCWRSS